MPREHIWGDVVTVRRGDLPVLAARTARDVTQLDARTAPSHPPVRPTTSDRDVADVLDDLATARSELTELRLRHGVLRRRHQLLSEFVERLGRADFPTPLDFATAYARELTALQRRLDRLPLDRAGTGADDDDDDLGADDPSHPDTYADPDPAFPTTEPPTDADAAPTTTDADAAHADAAHAQLDAALATDLTGSALDADERAEHEATARWAARFARPRAFRRAGEPDPGAGEETVELQLALVLSWVRDGGLVNVGIVGHDHATGREHDVGGFHMTLNWASANKLIKKTRVARDQSHGAPE